MSMKLKEYVLLLLGAAGFSQPGNAQTTNVAAPVVTITRLEGGVFVDFSAEIGRIYRLESSTTLTNWTLVDERIADATNMQFLIENTNITFNVPTNSGGGGPAEPPGFNGLSMFSGTHAALGVLNTTSSEGSAWRVATNVNRWQPPLPYPWEPQYRPQPRPQAAQTLATMHAALSASALESATGQEESVFYRVTCPETRIAFPNWVPFTDQFLYFVVWTSLTNAGSTYQFVLSRDGEPIFTNAAAVPASGTFGVADGQYNAADWPFTGYYSASKWSLSGTVAPPGPITSSNQTIQFNIDKYQRKSFPVSRGLVANQHGLLIFLTNDWLVLEEDFNAELLAVYDFSLSGAYQVDLNFAFRDPPQTTLENLNGLTDWGRLKTCLYSNPLSHLHYFGHGAPDRIGLAAAGHNLALNELKKSPRTNNPLHYVALDGCQVVKKSTDMLSAFVGYKNKITRQQAAANGFLPGYGWGWKEVKPIGYRKQGALYYQHFYFIKDFYQELNHRNGLGLLDRSYDDARRFALDPNGLGFGGGELMHNPEGEDFDYVGCYTCYFDDF